MEGVSRFSARTSWDAAESSYAAAVREARASGRRLYDLTVSNPTRCGFAYDAEALLAPLKDARALVYDPDPRGMLAAREAVARYYADHGAEVAADEVVLTTSTSESYSYLFRLLCDPGDEVLIAQPSYPLFDFLADLDDVRLRPYPLFYDHGWWIDLAELERAVTPRTRAVIVVHPNNPTGHWTGAREREALEELCARHGLALIVDEVFLDYPLRAGWLAGESEARSFACGEHPALTFVLSGLSKIVGLPQMKAAWIAAFGPAGVKAEAVARLEIVADTFLSMNAPVQLAMPSWLAGRRAIQSEILERVRGNLATLGQIADQARGELQVLRSDAGWSAVLGLTGCVGERDCAERLVRERGVIVHPGGFYGMAEKSRVVVSLLGIPSELRGGILRANS
jgi:alanine-synthesizing transaminase